MYFSLRGTDAPFTIRGSMPKWNVKTDFFLSNVIYHNVRYGNKIKVINVKNQLNL